MLPTPELVLSKNPKEGESFGITLVLPEDYPQSSYYLPEDIFYYYKISGIDSDDLDWGNLSGIVGGYAKEIRLALKADSDFGENLEISLYQDAEMTQQIGSTYSVPIEEADPNSSAEWFLTFPDRSNIETIDDIELTSDGIIASYNAGRLAHGRRVESTYRVSNSGVITSTSDYPDVNAYPGGDLTLRSSGDAIQAINIVPGDTNVSFKLVSIDNNGSYV